jgi:calcineurin-like phosphoesterase family protein
MELITPISPERDYADKKIVFLAGPIKGAPDWQAQAIKDLADLDVYVANPRRENVINFNLDLQVNWESRFLAAADVIMFWIPPKETDVSGRDYAQTSRFELAEWMAKTHYNHTRKQVVVGIDDAFFGKSYIVKRLQAENVPVYSTYAETLSKVRSLLKSGGRIFFTSDTHFGSSRAMTLSRRPFISVKEMDAALILNWNNEVASDDVVYHLGDFGDLNVRPYLHGKIHFILGNYETDAIKENADLEQQLKKCFADVLPHNTLTLKNGEPVYLTHKPSECKKDMFNLFGHIHGLRKVSTNGLNVGVDANHFRPISEDDVLFFKNAILNHYDYEVFL